MGSTENQPSEKEILGAKAEVDAEARVRSLVETFLEVPDSEITDVVDDMSHISAIISGHRVEVRFGTDVPEEFEGVKLPAPPLYSISIDGSEEVDYDENNLGHDLVNRLNKLKPLDRPDLV